VSKGAILRHSLSVLGEDRRRRFEDIYTANCTPILGYALRRTGSGEDAADIVAETFLTAWRRLDDVPPGDEARLWLYGVARRMLANYHRGERRKTELAERLSRDLALVHTDPEYTGRLALVAAAFRGLPESDRELLALVGWEGLDHGEIAVVLGCSRNAVRVRLHRARARFAKAVGQSEDRPQFDAHFPAMNGDRA
jgi:RNA polymerase sigma-70 factor (ECF subfamily)